MIALYYASHILSAPFYLLAWLFYWAAHAMSWIGDLIFGATTYTAWRVLHRRACAKKEGA